VEVGWCHRPVQAPVGTGHHLEAALDAGRLQGDDGWFGPRSVTRWTPR
jgi:hypothetical protein